MLTFILLLCCLLGYQYVINQVIKTIHLAPIVTISTIGVCLFTLGLIGVLEWGTYAVFVFGMVLFFYFSITHHRVKFKSFIFSSPTSVFVTLLIVSYGFTYGMLFRIDDDFRFWGSVSKLIYYTNQLPQKDTPLLPQHLTYPPMLAMVHYFVFKINMAFYQPLAFFAQNLVMMSALMVLYDKSNIRKSLFYIILALLLFTIIYGTILAKLRVDHLIGVYFSCILWAYFSRSEKNLRTIVILTLPIVFMSLFKQIGGYVAISTIVLMSCDQLIRKKFTSTNYRSIGLVLLLLFGSILMYKFLWVSYWQSAGFSPFTQGINFSKVIATFDISNPNIKVALIIYLKNLLFSSSDQLHLSYLIWLFILTFLWWKIISKTPKNEKSSYQAQLLVFMVFLLVYVVMIYILQVTQFSLGLHLHTPLSLPRYINLYFGGFAVYSILMYLSLALKNKQMNPFYFYLILMITVSITVFGKVSRQVEPNRALRKEAMIIMEKLVHQSNNYICVLIQPAVAKATNIRIKMLFYLLPNHVNHWSIPTQDVSAMKKSLSGCDYLYLYQVDENTISNLKKLWKADYQMKQLYLIQQHDPIKLKLQK